MFWHLSVSLYIYWPLTYHSSSSHISHLSPETHRMRYETRVSRHSHTLLPTNNPSTLQIDIYYIEHSIHATTHHVNANATHTLCSVLLTIHVYTRTSPPMITHFSNLAAEVCKTATEAEITVKAFFVLLFLCVWVSSCLAALCDGMRELSAHRVLYDVSVFLVDHKVMLNAVSLRW